MQLYHYYCYVKARLGLVSTIVFMVSELDTRHQAYSHRYRSTNLDKCTTGMNILPMHLLCLFHRIYAISVKLSPAKHSSGIQCLEADSFKLYCFQTITGISIPCFMGHSMVSFPDPFLLCFAICSKRGKEKNGKGLGSKLTLQ